MNYNARISDIEAKYLITADYNKFTSEIFEIQIKEKRLIDKSGIFDLVKNSDLKTKLATLATKAELKAMQDQIVELEAFNSSYFHDISHFEDDAMQNLFFHAVHRNFKKLLTAIIFQQGNQKIA